jgi:hypothetical protein
MVKPAGTNRRASEAAREREELLMNGNLHQIARRHKFEDLAGQEELNALAENDRLRERVIMLRQVNLGLWFMLAAALVLGVLV